MENVSKTIFLQLLIKLQAKVSHCRQVPLAESMPNERYDLARIYYFGMKS